MEKREANNLITFFITCFVIICFASDSLYSQLSGYPVSKRFTITTSAFEYFPDFKLNTTNYNLGSEIACGKGQSIAFNVGFIQSQGPPQGFFVINSLSTRGFKEQLEWRFYHNKLDEVMPFAGFYFALHEFYKFTVTKRQETVVDYIDNNPFPNSYHYKENIYTVHRNVFGLNIKAGYQYVSSYGLVIDTSFGLGGQLISSSSRNSFGGNLSNDIPWGKLFDSGSGIYPNAVFHIKLGWAF